MLEKEYYERELARHAERTKQKLKEIQAVLDWKLNGTPEDFIKQLSEIHYIIHGEKK